MFITGAYQSLRYIPHKLLSIHSTFDIYVSHTSHTVESTDANFSLITSEELIPDLLLFPSKTYLRYLDLYTKKTYGNKKNARLFFEKFQYSSFKDKNVSHYSSLNFKNLLL